MHTSQPGFFSSSSSDPAACESKDFDGGPSPERVVFFVAEIAALAGYGVVGPDLLGGLDDRAGERLSRGGECLAGRSLAGGLQHHEGVLAPLVDGAHEHRQDR